MKSMKLMFFAIIVLTLAIGGVALFRDFNNNKFVWDYQVTTDDQWTTMENDGGSNISTYYRINFENRQIQKCEDKYFAPMKRYDYQGKVIYQKDLDEKTAAKFKEVLDKIWNNSDASEGTYDYYSIEKADGGTHYVHNKTFISQIQQYTNKIDKQAE